MKKLWGDKKQKIAFFSIKILTSDSVSKSSQILYINPSISQCSLSFRRMSDMFLYLRERHWAKSLAFKSILIYALLFSPLSLCVPRLGHFRCPFALPFSRIVHTNPNSSLLSAQCSRYSTKTRENGVLNSEFNYSRPSEMLVSRWIKPGSLSKPILDLKGRKKMCFRNISVGLFAFGQMPPTAAAVRPDRLHAAKSYKCITTERLSNVVVNISRNWVQELQCLCLHCAWQFKVWGGKKDLRFTVWSKCLECLEGPFPPQTDGGRRFLTSLGEEKPLIFSLQ